jgi:hypothetical protein
MEVCSSEMGALGASERSMFTDWPETGMWEATVGSWANRRQTGSCLVIGFSLNFEAGATSEAPARCARAADTSRDIPLIRRGIKNLILLILR